MSKRQWLGGAALIACAAPAAAQIQPGTATATGWGAQQPASTAVVRPAVSTADSGPAAPPSAARPSVAATSNAAATAGWGVAQVSTTAPNQKTSATSGVAPNTSTASSTTSFTAPTGQSMQVGNGVFGGGATQQTVTSPVGTKQVVGFTATTSLNPNTGSTPGQQGPHFNNGGANGASDGILSDAYDAAAAAASKVADGAKAAWDATLGASGRPASDISNGLNGNDSGSSGSTGGQGGGKHVLKTYANQSVDDRQSYAGPPTANASNGSTVNLGSHTGGGGDTPEGASGQGSTDVVRNASNGGTVNVGAKAGGDAPLKPNTGVEALNSAKVTNGASDPTRGH